MAYVINKYNGTVLTNVEDGTVNTVTELKFIGKNYSGYGEAQNENFLFLLENFANTSAPTRPISGMIWYDSGTNKLKFYDGSKWKLAGSADASITEPAGYVEGDFWWDTSTNQLKVKNSSGTWTLIGPQAVGSGITQMQSRELVDTLGTTYAVIAATIKDEVVYIISPNEFTNSSSTAISGFTVIKRGLTLVNTDSTTGVTSSAHRYWGTASNALRLNGRLASDYVTTDSSSFSGEVAFSDPGLTVGSDTDLSIKIDTDNETPLLKLWRNALRFRASNNNLIFTITDTGLIPGTDDTFNIGSALFKWATVHATTFSGTATQADKLKVGSSYYSASTASTVNTIASRDASGNLTAVVFNGTATKARYADLAEKYSTAEELAPGTAVAVCKCEDHDVEPASASQFCIGVVSTEPAIMMNSEAEGQYIALKGRVPVRIAGPVKKGQAVYAMADGVSTTLATTALVGIALESNDSIEEKLVECVLKV
jgi:hypothetical protein